MTSTNSLKNKVALVTGGARRIGAEVCRALHAEGMNIIIHYNASEDEASNLTGELNKIRDNSAVKIRADLLESGIEKSLVTQAKSVWGKLDLLVNNASRFYRTHFGKVTEYAWEDLMNSNLRAPFFLAQAAAPALAEVHGRIINIADVHAWHPMRNYSVYCMTKSGVIMLTKSLAKELGPNVTVNAIAPGAIVWPEGENSLSDDEKETIIHKTPYGRSGKAEDISKAVIFLARDADFMTGETLAIDGGRNL